MSQTWIFQANPGRFNIEGMLASYPATFTWLATRHRDQIRVGDQVFLWRTSGHRQQQDAGVVAEAEIIEPSAIREPEASETPFWLDPSEIAPSHRVLLRLTRVARAKEALRRKWLLDDPILCELPNIKMAAGTNFLVPSPLADRLNNLWLKTGHDWTWAESVAGLWAYAQTYGNEVSKLPGSPVSIVSEHTGRAVAGVYNKVMNFRALDPRDQRTGMAGSGKTDGKVWATFFDADNLTLRIAEIDTEFRRLWGTKESRVSDEADAATANTLADADRLSELSLEELLDRYQRNRKVRPRKPKAKSTTTRTFDRDPLVVAIAKKRAAFKCEVHDCGTPPFLDTQGKPYCEVHHLVGLAQGGEDSLENVACLCPSHHREIHLGADRDKLTAILMEYAKTR